MHMASASDDRLKHVAGHIARTNLLFFASIAVQSLRGLILIPLLLRLLHASGYGQWVLVASWVSYAIIVLLLALDTSIYQYVTPAMGTPRSRAIYWTILRIAALWSAALFAIVGIGILVFAPAVVAMLVMACGALAIGQTFWTLLLTPFRCEERTHLFFGTSTLILLGDFAVTAATAALFRQLLPVVVVLAAYHLSVALILFVVQQRRFPALPWLREIVRPSLIFGVSATYLQLLSSGFFVFDKSIVSHFAGVAALAGYAPPMALAIVLLPLNASGTVTLPTLLVRPEVRASKHLKSVIFQHALQQWGLITIPAAVGVALIAKPFLTIIVGPTLAASSLPIAALAAATLVAEGLCRFSYMGLRVENEVAWLTIAKSLQFAGFLVGAILLCILLPQRVPIVVVAAIFVSNFVFAVIGMVRLRRYTAGVITARTFATPLAGTAAFLPLMVVLPWVTSILGLIGFVTAAIIIYAFTAMLIERVSPLEFWRVLKSTEAPVIIVQEGISASEMGEYAVDGAPGSEAGGWRSGTYPIHERFPTVFKGPRMFLKLLRNALERWRRRAVIAQGRTDYHRWSVSGGWSNAWEERARMAASLIAPGATVLDLGCGEMVLERFLPPNCVYIPSDCVARDARTIVSDYNEAVPAIDTGVDTICVLGVLEYLYKLPDFMRAITSSRKALIVSYCPSDLTENLDRAGRGWVNNFTSAVLEQMFKDNGYLIANSFRVDAHQLLYELQPTPSLGK
jgi:O-antigen/teichoic acid export membrane protein